MLGIIIGVIVGVAIVYIVSLVNNKFGYMPFAALMKSKTNGVRAFPPLDDVTNEFISPKVSGNILRTLKQAGSQHSSEKSSFEEAVQAYQAENKCRLILINQKPGMAGGGLFGLGEAPSSIGLAEAATLIDILGTIPSETPLHIILRSCGGTLQAAEIISHALRHHKGEIFVFVSQYAQSAATLIALNATHLYMNANAFLTPTDPQIMGYSVHTIIKLADRVKQIDGIAGVMVAAMQDIAKGALKRSVDQLLKVLPEDDPLTKRLLGEHGHDQPIFATELETMLKSLKIGIPNSVRNIIELDDGPVKSAWR